MNFLDELIEWFDKEMLAVDLGKDASIEPLLFVDDGSFLDQLSIDEIAKQFQLTSEESEEFLEVTQSIQHSLAMFDNTETLKSIDDYIDSFNQDPSRLIGLINNVKGIYGEHEVYERLKESYGDDIIVIRNYATNNPGTDFEIFNHEGTLLEKIQVKVTSDADYVLNTRESLPDDIKIVTTDEAIADIIARTGDLPDGIFSIDITNAEITRNVERTISILSKTEPEFELLIGDPVITEHLEQGINPFEASANDESFGRKLYSDWQDRPITNNTYSNFTAMAYAEFEDAIPYVVDWSHEGFTGVGTPLEEASHWVQQESDTSCAVVTQRNILQSLTGQTFTEEELSQYAEQKGFYDPSTGTPSENMSSILQDKGLICDDRINASFSDIENALDRGEKVMVGLDASEVWMPLRSLDTGDPVEQPNLFHCLQVSGIDYSDPSTTMVILADPGITDGEMKAVALEDFLNSWEDTGKRVTIVSR